MSRACPFTVDEIVTFLIEMYHHENNVEAVEMLSRAAAKVEESGYDRWDGGTYSYTLTLSLSVPIFARLEPRVAALEADISSKLVKLSRGWTNDHLEKVVIVPALFQNDRNRRTHSPTAKEVSHLWSEGYFRLFLSHVSAHKVTVAALKQALQSHGISAFVAHEDIKPSREWQNEILLALGSMHALAAVLTTDFHASNWTDQEIGFALGLGVQVVALNMGAQPYGFVGKFQSVRCEVRAPNITASRLADILHEHPSSSTFMRAATFAAFSSAGTFIQAITLSKRIAEFTTFSEAEKRELLSACQNNRQVFNATGVVERIHSKLGITSAQSDADVSADNDIPF